MKKVAHRDLNLLDTIGNTPLVRLESLPGAESLAKGNAVYAKLESNNPTGSIKDRTIEAMVRYAEEAGSIRPGDTLIEATNGNSGISLAMISARKGYKCTLVMPENTSIEKQQYMAIYGAEIILTPKQSGMGFARSVVYKMAAEGQGIHLDQYANLDNPRVHYETTAPEIWKATNGSVTHLICGMGTTGTIMGLSRYLKEKNPAIQIIGYVPEAGTRIPGLQHWSENSMPIIYDEGRVDRLETVSLAYAEHKARRMAAEEGIFCGLSSAAGCDIALRLSRQVSDARIVFMVADRGDRYLSMGVFPV